MTINGYEVFIFLLEYWDSAANPRYYLRVTVRVQNQCYAHTYSGYSLNLPSTPQDVYAGATLQWPSIM